MNPEPRFAWKGESTVAYEVVGDGPVDLVYMPGFINNLEVVWNNPHGAKCASVHDQVVRAQLGRHRGVEIKTMGDGFLATFDRPARGITCARTIADAIGAASGHSPNPRRCSSRRRSETSSSAAGRTSTGW
jgi:hypothetical protein